jgi:hypothetical protein
MLAIAALIKAGEFSAAETHLNSSLTFEDASNSLADAIMALDRLTLTSKAS